MNRELTDSDKLPTVRRCPSPRGGTLAKVIAQVRVAQEGVEVGVVASEGVAWIPTDSLSDAVLALRVPKLAVLGAVVSTRRLLASKLGLDNHHNRQPQLKGL